VERRERHLRVVLARLTVGRGAVTGTPIPRRVIVCRFQRHTLSPRVSPLCNVDCAVYIALKRHDVALVVRTPECGLGGPVPDVTASVAGLAGVLRSDVLDRDTGQTCHECGHIGSRGSQAEFKCTNDDCHVTEFQADINAAANIAGRVNPWGESVPLKPERDDSPRNGSASDSATVHRETSEKTLQMTLAAYSD
jgi:hypothetical protein